jgi:uncharacterized protein (TIGR01777 family)
VSATRTIAGALRTLHERGDAVPALVSASAVGYYGSRPGVELTEADTAGEGFFPDVVARWEAAALAVADVTRVALARTGMVLDRTGALAPLRLLTSLGFAGPISGGRQHWPWISMTDEVAALLALIDGDGRGPVNLVGPTQATAAELVRALARALRRPYWFPAPLAGLLGEGGREMLGLDQRIRPAVLESIGFGFTHPTVAAAIDAALRAAK